MREYTREELQALPLGELIQMADHHMRETPSRRLPGADDRSAMTGIPFELTDKYDTWRASYVHFLLTKQALARMAG